MRTAIYLSKHTHTRYFDDILLLLFLFVYLTCSTADVKEKNYFLAFFSATKIKLKFFWHPFFRGFLHPHHHHVSTHHYFFYCTDYICKNINLHVMFYKRVLFRNFKIDAIATYNIALFFYIRASLLFNLFIFSCMLTTYFHSKSQIKQFIWILTF